MNTTKEILEGLEEYFSKHEIWTKSEIKEVLNSTWLEVDKKFIQMHDVEMIQVCQVTKKILPDEEMYMDEVAKDVFCHCHRKPIEEKES